MRAVIQRIKQAWVKAENEEIKRVGRGLLVLLGVEKDDTEKDALWLAKKIAFLRIFEDNQGKMNLSLQQIKGEILVVSNFTLCGDARKGRRPSFDQAASPKEAQRLYNFFCEALQKEGISIKQGYFGAYMEVGLVNDGPVTFILSSKKEF